MAELYDQITAHVHQDETLHAIASQSGIDSTEHLEHGLRLSTPIVLHALCDWAYDAPTSLIESLQGLAPAARSTTTALDQAATGGERARPLLGDRVVPAVVAIEVEAGLSTDQSTTVLESVADVVQACLAERLDAGMTVEQLTSLLRAEQSDLLHGGWEEWLGAVRDHRAPAAPGEVATPLQAAGSLPQTAATIGGKHHTEPKTTSKPEAAAPTSGARPVDRAAGPEPGVSDGSHGHLVLIGIGALVLIGAVAALLANQGGSSDETAADETVAAESRDDETVATETNRDDGVGESSSSGGRSTDEGDEGDEGDEDSTVEPVSEEMIQTFGIPLTDIKGTNPDATGSVDLVFNRQTGEICYTFAAENIDTPFAGHIHVGADGVRGGIVVDFGDLENPASGCVDNPPADTEDILTHRSSHYAELHDPSGEFTIRGQVGTGGETIDAPDLAFADPDGGGAQAVIEAGRIALRGEVADRATADRFAAEYVTLDLPGIDVVDQLTIVDGAPAPSGRVVMTDAILFDLGSGVMADTDHSVVEVLAAVVLARPDNTITIVGHTDNVGDPVANLELSLERANSLRDALLEEGVPIEQVRVEGAGDTDPIADNNTSDGRALNRRLEAEVRPLG